jgi:enamine deaminase RidA (YjgF/YER057c/UK114 family)
MNATAEKLVKAYIKMRDYRSQLKAQYEEQDNEVKEQMELVEAELLTLCKNTGADSLRTKFGTVSRTVQTRYWTGDWEAMHKFVMENNAPDLLERRIAQRSMQEFIKENPDMMPVGLNVDNRYTVSVRRSKA